MRTFLDFEKPVADLEGKIAELHHLSSTSDLTHRRKSTVCTAKLDALLKQTYSKLTAWQKAQAARQVDRPHTLDYIARLIEGFMPLPPAPRRRRAVWAVSAGCAGAPASSSARRRAPIPQRASAQLRRRPPKALSNRVRCWRPPLPLRITTARSGDQVFGGNQAGKPVQGSRTSYLSR